jgi:hypothetical protein
MQVSEESNILGNFPHSARTNGRDSVKSSKPWNSVDALAARVSSKLEEGDYKGAVRLACSRDTIAEHSTSKRTLKL